jgi:hypothetical protein
MFEAMFFGHFIGDYLLQTDWMATNKQAKTWTGLWACLLHCVAYSLTMLLSFFMLKQQILWFVFIIAFLTHFPIDRYALGKTWMKLIKQVPPDEVYLIDDFQKRESRKMFSPIVYVVTDNVLHMALMWNFLHYFIR